MRSWTNWKISSSDHPDVVVVDDDNNDDNDESPHAFLLYVIES